MVFRTVLGIYLSLICHQWGLAYMFFNNGIHNAWSWADGLFYIKAFDFNYGHGDFSSDAPSCGQITVFNIFICIFGLF